MRKPGWLSERAVTRSVALLIILVVTGRFAVGEAEPTVALALLGLAGAILGVRLLRNGNGNGPDR